MDFFFIYWLFFRVTETIKKIGGTMPEDLPTPEKSLKELEKEIKRNSLINN